MSELSTIYDYMRAHAGLLGERILQEFPALHQIDDPVSPRIYELLRKPFPAQAIAIMGLAKRWQQARTVMVCVDISYVVMHHRTPFWTAFPGMIGHIEPARLNRTYRFGIHQSGDEAEWLSRADFPHL